MPVHVIRLNSSCEIESEPHSAVKEATLDNKQVTQVQPAKTTPSFELAPKLDTYKSAWGTFKYVVNFTPLFTYPLMKRNP